jgi:DNA-binding PadR family transcriptional regulator
MALNLPGLTRRKASGQPLGLTQVAILASIEGGHATNGTAIAARISRMIGREVSDAQVYVALGRLQDRGFIASRADTATMPSERKRGRPKVHYALTAAGRRALTSAGAYLPSTGPFVQSSSRGTHGGTKKSPHLTPVVV